MRTLLIGSENKLKALTGHAIHSLEPQVVDELSDESFSLEYEEYGLIIDLNLDDNFDRMEYYAGLKDCVVLGSAVKKTLREMLFLSGMEAKAFLFGLNAWVGLMDKPIWEVSALKPEQADKLTGVLAATGIGTQFVEDHIGMVTPRVLAMILNEAHYMLQEGSATEADIDAAMLSGVNYPHGPFAWTDQIGIQDVYELLTALREEFGNDTYRISAILQRRYYDSWQTR